MDKLKSVIYLIAIFVMLIFMLPLLLLLSIYYVLVYKEDKVILNEAKKELAKFKRHYEEDESFRSQINEMSTFDKFNVYRCYMLVVNNKSNFKRSKSWFFERIRSIRLIKKIWPLPYAMWKPKEQSMYNEIRAKAWFLWALEDLGIKCIVSEDIEFIYNKDYKDIDIKKFENIFK